MCNINRFITLATCCLMLFKMQIMCADTFKVTADLISSYNYPVEEHIVHTPDDYILTMYRIPDSPNFKGTRGNTTNKPVVFLQHGILGASDDWIINGPQHSIAYALADAGYDVWLGNSRGNTYSREHKHKHPGSTDFWKFSWHEIGVYDLASMLDYVIEETNVTSVHFIGHSQGTTAFFVLLSSFPAYNEKMKTVHLLAPIVFMRNHSFILSKLGNLFMGFPSFISWIVGGIELLPITRLQKFLCEYVCSEDSMFKFLCSGIIEFVSGWGSSHMNHTLLADVCETHPAGASTTQIIHYLQLYKSGDFHQYDHGPELNMKYYKQETPPFYNISNIQTCVNLHYSVNDCMSSAEDVEYLATLLPCVALYRVPYEDWNHCDFLWSTKIKEVINDRIFDEVMTHEIKNS